MLLSIKKLTKLIYIFSYVIAFLLKCFFNFWFIAKLNIAASFFIYFILLMIFSDSKIIYKILTLGIYFGLSVFSESLTYHVSLLFVEWNEFVVIQMIVSKVILFLLILLIKFFKNINDEDNMDIKSTLLLSISIQPLSIILFIYTTNGISILNSNNRILTIISMLLMVSSNLISFYIFGEIIGKNRLKKELQFEKERLKENETYYASLKNNIENFKSYRHDLRHHFIILKSMLHSNNNEEAEKYINNLLDELVDISDQRCGDEFLDLVLSSRMHQINKLKINLEFELRKINIDFINKLDLNVIYGNIIDNAIESCSLCEKRNIKIQSMELNNRYQIIKVINSCRYVKMKDGKYVTTKNDDNIHGYGLTNIQKTIKKYNGYVSFLFDEKKEEFITTVYFDKKI